MLLDNEKELIKRFRETRIPLIFKIDKTDNILYIEHVDFDLCNMLLKGKKVKSWFQLASGGDVLISSFL